jgi:Cu(I)/Ag(I) efflux system protein CusF
MSKLMRIAPAAVAALLMWQASAAAQELAEGKVTKIDESAGKITMQHGPIKRLDMDMGMTMVFRVQDPALLKGIKVGDKVKFDADRVNGQITVTKLEKSK